MSFSYPFLVLLSGPPAFTRATERTARVLAPRTSGCSYCHNIESQPQISSALDQAQYGILDRLPNLSSSGQPVLGKRRKTSGKLELAMATGSGKASSIALLNQDIALDEDRELGIEDAQRIWTLATARQTSGNPEHPELGSEHSFVMTSSSEDESGSSRVFRIVDGEVIEPETSSFEAGVATLNAGLVHGGKKIVQITSSEVRCYPLGKSSSFPYNLSHT